MTLVGLGVALGLWQAHGWTARFNARACHSELRLLRGAIELYDQDYASGTMKVLDMDILVEKRYLKSPARCPGQGFFLWPGEFRNFADGTVGCTVHGNPYTTPID